ncbi:hypothetical protein NUW58_g6324 [Xylaria curta]|uniref:Uncharacterized protein n=1 Tax=Xylaria curta TaxID=42375 RepID=A0ACC1NW39_9PEZI|nr:hypothetical protein NUW58_g6324 [Xylaria curta]
MSTLAGKIDERSPGRNWGEFQPSYETGDDIATPYMMLSDGASSQTSPLAFKRLTILDPDSQQSNDLCWMVLQPLSDITPVCSPRTSGQSNEPAHSRGYVLSKRVTTQLGLTFPPATHGNWRISRAFQYQDRRLVGRAHSQLRHRAYKKEAAMSRSPQTPRHSRRSSTIDPTYSGASPHVSPTARRQSKSSFHEPLTPLRQSMNEAEFHDLGGGGVGQDNGLGNLADELAVENRIRVRINAIAPGVFPSEMTADESGEDQKSALSKEKYEEKIPAGRPGRDQDMAQAVLALVCNQYVNAEVLVVDGAYAAAIGQ